METSRVALIRYIGQNGTKRCVGSGLLVGDRQVLTADHIARGSGYHVNCAGGEFEVTAILRSDNPDVDLAILTLNRSAGRLGQLPCARVDRNSVGWVTGCVAVGFPRWKKDGAQRRTAQVNGRVPTAEDLESTANAGLYAGFLTLVGDRAVGAPLILDKEMYEEPDSPWGGMSGAGVVAGGMLIGVVRSHNLAAGGQSLTVTPLTALERLPGEIQRLFWVALGVPDPGGLPLLPGSANGVRASAAAPIALSVDVQELYRTRLGTSLTSPDLPIHWTFDELADLRHRVEASRQDHRKVTDMLTALCEATAAKSVFLSIGGSDLELGRLQVTYWREIGGWPDGDSADQLLVEAASAGIMERRCRSAPGPLGSLARFVIGAAAALRSPPQENNLMQRWIGSLGHQMADARKHYEQRQDQSSWLLIDLGDEPQRGACQWPDAVTWTLITKDNETTGEPVACDATKEGLQRALTDILQLVRSAHPLLVDLIVPRALMEEGIEHWPVSELDGIAEPLSPGYSPRLRWSRRCRDLRLRGLLLERAAQGSWAGEAKHWLRNDPRRACFLGGRDLQSGDDQLSGLLREGCGYVIWFPSGMPASAVRQITRAIRKIPVAARPGVLPDNLPDFGENHPAIIWDHPQGRGDFRLPPPFVPESP